MKNYYSERREKARKLMSARSLSALLVSFPADRFYLSGFELHDCQCNESSGYILITEDGRDKLCTDSRYLEAAKSLWDEEDIILYSSDIPRELNALCRGIVGTGTVGMDFSTVPHSFYSKFAERLSVEDCGDIIPMLRAVKDDAEIALMRKSADLNHRMLAWLPSILKEGMTEAEIAWGIERFFREHGAEECSFPSIVAINRHAASAHHIPGETAIAEDCHILFDVGCRLDGYCSDQTRTLWFGQSPDPRFLNILELVQEAQRTVLRSLRPGMSGSEAHNIAAGFFDSRGCLSAFTHSLGHGVGLEVHEAPRLSRRSDTVLKPGMIVTVEPGLYYPDYGGARWEHMALITEDGCRIL